MRQLQNTISSQIQQYTNDMHKFAYTSSSLNVSSLANNSNMTLCGKPAQLKKEEEVFD